MGEPLHAWTGHNTADMSGRVCCPKILANVCSKCNVRGHLSSRCTGRPDVFRKMAFVFRHAEPPVELATHVQSSRGGFDVLADCDSSPDASPRTPRMPVKASQMDWSIESDEEDAPPANVTIRSKVMRSWADDED